MMPIEPSSAPPPPLHVLIAEDSDADALLLEEALEEAGLGWRLERVEDGAGVLERLAEGPRPALVVLDLALPRVRGDDVLRALRAEQSPGLPPIAVVTGSPNPDEEAKCIRLGADVFLVKPSRPDGYVRLVDELARTVRGALGAAPERRVGDAASDGRPGDEE